jgi:hypothetical protein
MQSMPEMAIPMTTVYTPAWDEPVKAQASYFKTPSQEQSHIHDYPSLPTNVQKSDWYKKFTATEPSRDKIQTVFPWESETRRPTPSRSFPKDEKPFVAPPPAPKVRTMKAPGPIKIPAAGPVPAVVQVKQPVPTRAPLPAKQTFEEAMASYRNAWDGVASINRYAKGLSSIGIGVDRRTAGLASAPHTPHHRATNPFDAPEEEEEEDPGNYANALYRNRHTQTESPKLTDAVVQASPELSPPRSPQDQDKRVKITFRTKRPAAARNFPTYSFATTYTASRPAGAVGRVWDPQTDIEVRRQAAQHVVDQFVNVKNGGSD